MILLESVQVFIIFRERGWIGVGESGEPHPSGNENYNTRHPIFIKSWFRVRHCQFRGGGGQGSPKPPGVSPCVVASHVIVVWLAATHPRLFWVCLAATTPRLTRKKKEPIYRDILRTRLFPQGILCSKSRGKCYKYTDGKNKWCI